MTTALLLLIAIGFVAAGWVIGCFMFPRPNGPSRCPACGCTARNCYGKVTSTCGGDR